MRLSALLGVASLFPAVAAGQPALPEPGVSFAERECPALTVLGVDAHCGHLVVPEDYGNPGGLALRLPALRFGPVDRDNMAVLLGGGGPGARVALPAAHNALFWGHFRRTVLGDRGLLVVDQRGTGEDHLLRCPGHREEAEWVLTRDLSVEEEVAFYNIVAGSCRDRLRKEGIGLRNYTTRESARDYENLRRALGIRQLDLVGISYSSLIAFEMVEAYPDSVRAVLLDSPVIPDPAPLPAEVHVDRLFDRLAEECLADPGCGSVYGDMRSNLRTAMRRLGQNPMRMTYPFWETLPEEGRPRFVLNRPRMALSVLYAFYDEDLIARLPALLRDIALVGESGHALRYARNLAEFYRLDGLADGLYNTIVCREQVPFIRDEVPTRTGIDWLGPGALAHAREFCSEVWDAGPPIPPKPPGMFAHPVLFLSGTLDPVTPWEIAAEAAARLPGAQHVVVTGTHSVISTPCGSETARAFMARPRSRIDPPHQCGRRKWWL